MWSSRGSRSGAAAYQYTLSSVDRENLYTGSGKLMEQLKITPGFADVTSDLELGARQVKIEVDRDALAREISTRRYFGAIRFPDHASARAFIDSDEYAPVKQMRYDFADSTLLIVEGDE